MKHNYSHDFQQGVEIIEKNIKILKNGSVSDKVILTLIYMNRFPFCCIFSGKEFQKPCQFFFSIIHDVDTIHIVCFNLIHLCKHFELI